MKIVISAAGKGTRMLHLTKHKPKHLIKIRSKPFLYYLLKNIKKAGFFDIILVVGYKGEQIKEFLESPWYPDLFGKVKFAAKDRSKLVYTFSKPKYKITVINQFEILGTKKYGTACPLMAAEEAISREDFVSICGDNLYSSKDLKAFKIDDKFNYISGLEQIHPERYGTLIVEDGYLTKIEEKVKRPKSNIINTGLYKFTPEIFKAIGKIKPSNRGEYELTDAIIMLAKKKKVKVKLIQDYWLDFGNPADIMKLSKFLSQKH